jgi:predicted NBD/HSP70 family sugar kinase
VTRAWLPSDLRAHHRALILRLLDESGPLARSDLAHRSGLSIPTVTSILADLLEENRIADAGPDPTSKPGPRATMVNLARNTTDAIGVYLGVGKAIVGRCDLTGVVHEVREIGFAPGRSPAQVIRAVARAAAPLVAASGPQLVGFGIAVPGPVDATHRNVRLSLCLGWRDVVMADRMERALHVPTVVEYNVQAMALAERRYGLGLRAENLLYLYVGTGVGFAFLVDGEPLTYGPHGVSELGHHRVAVEGPPCACGVPGCLESVVNKPALLIRIAEAARHRPVIATACAQHAHPLAVLLAAEQAGDKVAAGLLTDFVDHLTTGLAAAINMLGPTRVVLGGIVADAPVDVHEQIRHVLGPKVCQQLREELRVEPAMLRRDSRVLGAAAVAFEHLLLAARPAPSRR